MTTHRLAPGHQRPRRPHRTRTTAFVAVAVTVAGVVATVPSASQAVAPRVSTATRSKPVKHAGLPVSNVKAVAGTKATSKAPPPVPASSVSASAVSMPAGVYGTGGTVNLPRSTTAAQAGVTPAAGAGEQLAVVGVGAWQTVPGSVVKLASAAGELGGPVSPMTAGSAGTSVSKVTIAVLTPAQAAAAGLSGVVVKVTRVDGSTASEPMAISVPTSVLSAIYGADYGARARWIQVPAPASGHKAALSSAQRDGSVLDAASKTQVVTAEVSGKSALVAATGGTTTSASGTGDFGASPLKPSSAWQVSAQTGAFSWSYPLRVPPAAAGPTPQLSLAYSSAVIDGETGATNNQSSQIGNGWDLAGAGSITRTYIPCALDTPTGVSVAATSPLNTGDQCWRTDNATVSLGGHSGTLVKGTDGIWRLSDDDGSKVEHLTGTSNGTYDGDYWRITTTDGTQYYFGLNRLPGWTTAAQNTNSVFTEPVYGANSGDPCHAATFAASSCSQAWQWNLDYVVDTHGNSEAYYYADEADNYTANSGPNTSTSNPSTVRSYIRSGYLTRIDYGMHAGSELTQQAPERVLFDHAQRCLAGSACTNHANWFDTPWDQDCTSGSCASKTSPTFFSEYLTSDIHTQLLSGGSYSDVDLWTLHQSFPSPGDGTSPSLWLTGISHQGSVGGTATVPDVSFTGTQLGNRILTTSSGANLTALVKWRLSAITTEAGATIAVSYLGPNCTSSTVSSIQPQSNTSRCYPTWWTPLSSNGYSSPAQLDWFTVYPVSSVISTPNTGGTGQAADQMYYDYLGNAGWRYDTSPLTPDGKRTWNVFAGYASVRIRHGDPSSPATEQSTTYTYFQGLNGDRLNSSGGTKTVTLTASDGTSVTDSLWWAGRVLEAVTTNGVGGATLTDIVTMPWAAQTGTDGINVSVLTNTAWSKTYTAISTGTRTGVTTNSIDSHGRITASDDNPDTSNASLEKCTLTSYADNTTATMLDFPDDVQVIAGPCGTNTGPVSTPPAATITEVRMSYDGASFGTAPSKGDVTSVATLKSLTGPAWITTTTSYDSLGRPVSVTTPLHPAATTAYTPAAATSGDTGPLTRTTATNAMGWSTVTTLNPAWGSPTSTTDPNGNVTTGSYDPLGRLVSVWDPNHPQASNPTSPSLSYAYTVSNTAATAVAATTLMADGQTQTTYTLYDGLLRARQTQAPSEGGGSIITDTMYDAAGNVSTTNGSYYAASNPSATLFIPSQPQNLPTQDRFTYDGDGRQLSDTLWVAGTQKWATTHAYPGADRVDTTPPAGGTATTTYTDAEGNTTSLLQYHAATPTGAADTTSYTYTPAGQMASMTDAAGNQWTWTYDLLGRKITAVDPDTGTTTDSYDDAGRLITSTDARGQSLTYTYDNDDRKTAEYAGTTATGTPLITWTYDTLKLGELTSATRNTSSGAYTDTITGYDTDNNITGSSITIPASQGALAGTYTTSATFNINDEPTSTTEPTLNGQAVGGLPKETLNYGYDNFGELGDIDNGSDYYLFETDFNHLNQVTALWGASTSEVQTVYGYEQGTNRLTSILGATIGSSSTVVTSNTSYAYDSAGNVTTDTTVANNLTDTQCFTYNYLRELTQAWTPASNSCAGQASTAALGGPAPYAKTYSYDTTGDRTSTTSYPTTSGGTTTTDTYAYPTPGAGVARPNAVTTVTHTATTGGSTTTTGTSTYSYDADGDTTSRPGETLTYDAEGHLATVTTGGKTQTDTYDPAGNLLIQADPTTGTTLYLGDTELHVAPGSTTVTGTRTYSAYGHPIAEHTTSSTASTTPVLTWLTGNDQNTILIDTNDTTGAVTVRYLDPFGNPRGPATSWPDTHGFLNASTSTSTGLTQLGARQYDPTLGRFTTVDPLLETNDPQAINGYAYADNNPTTDTDPTGLMIRDPGYDGKGQLINDEAAGDSNVTDPSNRNVQPPGQANNNNDWTTWHNNVQADAIGKIENQAVRLGWHVISVRSLVIPNASKSCMNNSGPCAGNGIADIVLRATYGGHETDFVWEVKIFAQRNKAYNEVGWYQSRMIRNYYSSLEAGKPRGTNDVRRGWMIGGPYAGEASGPNTRYWGEYGGVIVYSNKSYEKANSYISQGENAGWFNSDLHSSAYAHPAGTSDGGGSGPQSPGLSWGGLFGAIVSGAEQGVEVGVG